MSHNLLGSAFSLLFFAFSFLVLFSLHFHSRNVVLPSIDPVPHFAVVCWSRFPFWTHKEFIFFRIQGLLESGPSLRISHHILPVQFLNQEQVPLWLQPQETSCICMEDLMISNPWAISGNIRCLMEHGLSSTRMPCLENDLNTLQFISRRTIACSFLEGPFPLRTVDLSSSTPIAIDTPLVFVSFFRQLTEFHQPTIRGSCCLVQ